ncbi:MAG: SpoIID/LytB domain-containing protein [Pseudomonadota bacterium]
MLRISIFTIFVINIMLHMLSFQAYAEPDIRILIDRNKNPATISAEAGEITFKGSSGFLKSFTSANISISKGKLAINGVSTNETTLEITSKGDFIKYKNAIYHAPFNLMIDKGKVLIINPMGMEQYLIGIVGSELPSKWPLVAAKAQAVASRTYAMRQKMARKDREPFDVVATVHDQVYHGAQKQNAVAKKAVISTRGEILLKDGKIFHAYFHSCCGGKTEKASNVWSRSDDFKTVTDPYCKKYAKFSWNYKVPKRSIAEVLSKNGYPIGDNFEISTTGFENSPRNDKLMFVDDHNMQLIGANKLRELLGYQNLRSTWFELEESKTDVSFSGRGSGHGVGMCQWGAKGMAEAGKKYKEILDFYYNGTKVVKFY